MTIEPTHRGYPVSQVTLVADDLRRGIHAVVGEARRQRDGSVLWCIRWLGNVLTHDGEWELEPIPSSRDDDFMRRTRWASLDNAIDAWERRDVEDTP